MRVASGAYELKFSYIGYEEQQVNVGSRPSINIILTEETSILDEVVVVGYGTQRKVNLTSSVAAVSIDEKITSRLLTIVSSGLQGLIPSLQVSQTTRR